MFPWSLLCQAARIFVLLAWLDVPMDVRATEINTTTIDDADSHIQYSKNWNVSGDCDECSTLIPVEERKSVYQATWHDAKNWEADMHFNLTFTGFNCSVYGILRNGNQTKIGYSTRVDLTFIMDGNNVDTFVNEPSSEDQWVFDKLVFSKDNMTEGSHNLTVRLNPKSFFIFDYLRISSDPSRVPLPPTTTPNPNTTIIAPIVGVVGAVIFIGLIVFLVLRRRKKGGVQVVVPDDPFLLVDHPQGSDTPPAHISPFYVTPQDANAGRTEYNRGHEGILLLSGAPVTGDRKRKQTLYDVPEAPVSSHLLHDLRESQVASASSAGVPSRESSPPTTIATYARSTNRESAYSAMPLNYAHTASESRDVRSAQLAQIVAPIPVRHRTLTTPSLSVPPPVQPVQKRTSLYPSAVTAADVSQKRMHSLPPPEI